ncbi:MAG: dTDP-glucose 4,6-dehydratase [Actinomycetota bacterium]
MKLLITGGMGFIGSNFIRYLINKYPDYRIINLDIMSYAANPDNLRDIEGNPRYKFVKGDICDPQIVDELAKDVDVIINFAAQSHVDRSILGPESFIKTDIYGTYVLLEAAKKYGHERYVQIGTDECYGSIEKGSFKESDPLNPSSPYAASKGAADLLVHSYWVTFGLPILITRSSNNFGPYQYPEKLIPLFITNALEDEPLPLYGDGRNVRDWIYVIDNCEGIDFVLHKGKEGEIYNIAGGNERTNWEITEIILRELGKPKNLIKFVKDRPGHDRRYSLNCQKIHQLGWRPRHNFEDAMRETIRWYVDNRWWWERIKSGEFKEYYRKMYHGR